MVVPCVQEVGRRGSLDGLGGKIAFFDRGLTSSSRTPCYALRWAPSSRYHLECPARTWYPLHTGTNPVRVILF